MSQKRTEIGAQDDPGITEANVRCTAVELIMAGKTVRHLPDEMKKRVTDLLRSRMIFDTDDDTGLIGDEDMGASVPNAVELAAVKIVILDKPTRCLMGMKRLKVERLFRGIINSEG